MDTPCQQCVQKRIKRVFGAPGDAWGKSPERPIDLNRLGYCTITHHTGGRVAFVNSLEVGGVTPFMATMPLFRSCPEACGHRALSSSSQLSLWQHVNQIPEPFWTLAARMSEER